MANENKNTNELVTDDDPTSELEALTDRYFHPGAQPAADLNAETGTYDVRDETISSLRSDLQDRSETINRLQFDMEQLRAKWTGLETEIQARETATRGLHQQIDDLKDNLKRRASLLKERDRKIRSLKSEIRDRNVAHEATISDIETLQAQLAEISTTDSDDDPQLLSRQAGRLAANEIALREMHQRNQRLEDYADELRRKLQDRNAESKQVLSNRDNLQQSLSHTEERVEKLCLTLESREAELAEVQEKLNSIEERHTEDLRILRFELGEAQETATQHQLINEQLTSDLVDTRNFRLELEESLQKSEEQSREELDRFDRENRKLRKRQKELEEQVQTKSEAINCLINELTRKSQQIETIDEIESVIHEIDDRMSERIDEIPPVIERDKVTRLLIGEVEGQKLRFPLFKDRLTIGRTQQNDIQLKASYVSRRHAVIVTEGDATRVIDWGSKNGVFVNSKRITEHFLASGDIVTVGTAEFRYEERPKRDL
ncbi:MAG: FHA domain-containing protein [Pseudomonadota bacterium]